MATTVRKHVTKTVNLESVRTLMVTVSIVMMDSKVASVKAVSCDKE